MKKKLISLFALVLCFSFLGAQESQFPEMTLPDLNGNRVNLKELSSEKTIAIAFWATWCGPCMLELNAINDKLNDWNDEADFKFYAISIDDAKTVNRVRSLVNGRGWEFDVLLDTNSELKRLLNFSTPPFTVIVKDGNILYRHLGYQPGVEEKMFDKIKEHSN